MSSVVHCVCGRSGVHAAIKMYHRDRMNSMNVKQVRQSLQACSRQGAASRIQQGGRWLAIAERRRPLASRHASALPPSLPVPSPAPDHPDPQQVSREIEIHASLLHPNVVRLYAAFEDADGIYLVQEYASRGE